MILGVGLALAGVAVCMGMFLVQTAIWVLGLLIRLIIRLLDAR